MKQTFFIIALSVLVFTGCSKKETVITGQFAGDSNFLLYSEPLSGTNFYYFNDTLKLDDAGNFELKFNLTQPAFVNISNPEPYKEVKLLIEPGNTYHVVFGAEKEPEITGANEKGQMLYTKFPNPFFVEMAGRSYFRDTSLTSINSKINSSKENDLSELQKLFDNKEISQSFFDMAKADRDCYYASMAARVSLIKIYMMMQTQDKPYMFDNVDMLENLKEIYAKYPPEDEKYLLSTFWSEYVTFYITDYLQFSKPDFSFDKLREQRVNGEYNTIFINDSKNHLKGKALEFFQAKYLFVQSVEGDYEKDLIPLFEQFKKDYPKSEYTRWIEPNIQKIIDYYEAIEKSYSENVKFMDGYDTFNTLEDVLAQLKGKKVYIDVWATWCGSCIEEFKHKAALEKVLAENDIQLLYISIDNEQRNQKWKDGIKYYQLNGIHMRTNEELYVNLMKLYSNNVEKPSIVIPWYILIDEEGNIMEKHTKSPSQIAAGEKILQ